MARNNLTAGPTHGLMHAKRKVAKEKKKRVSGVGRAQVVVKGVFVGVVCASASVPVGALRAAAAALVGDVIFHTRSTLYHWNWTLVLICSKNMAARIDVTGSC